LKDVTEKKINYIKKSKEIIIKKKMVKIKIKNALEDKPKILIGGLK